MDSSDVHNDFAKKKIFSKYTNVKYNLDKLIKLKNILCLLF